MVERKWIEVNTRVNYPVKEVLVEMMEQGDIYLEDLLHNFCMSWFTIKLLCFGVELNLGIIIPSQVFTCTASHLLKNFITPMYSAFYMHTCSGRRRGGMASPILNKVMQSNNTIARIDPQHLPDATAAVGIYNLEGGNISDGAQFGCDPLNGHAHKMSIRHQAFSERYIYHLKRYFIV